MTNSPRDLTLFLHRWELDSMPEYSSTLPTATTLGKVWKRREKLPVGDRPAEGEWIVGLYAYNIESETARDRRLNPSGWTRILWFDVALREGPEPPGWRPPDWSNYAAWKAQRDIERASTATA